MDKYNFEFEIIDNNGNEYFADNLKELSDFDKKININKIAVYDPNGTKNILDSVEKVFDFVNSWIEYEEENVNEKLNEVKDDDIDWYADDFEEDDPILYNIVWWNLFGTFDIDAIHSEQYQYFLKDRPKVHNLNVDGTENQKNMTKYFDFDRTTENQNTDQDLVTIAVRINKYNNSELIEYVAQQLGLKYKFINKKQTSNWHYDDDFNKVKNVIPAEYIGIGVIYMTYDESEMNIIEYMAKHAELNPDIFKGKKAAKNILTYRKNMFGNDDI